MYDAAVIIVQAVFAQAHAKELAAADTSRLRKSTDELADRLVDKMVDRLASRAREARTGELELTWMCV